MMMMMMMMKREDEQKVQTLLAFEYDVKHITNVTRKKLLMKAFSVHRQQRNPNSSAYATTTRTRMWTNAQRDGPQPNIGGALCKSP